MNNRLILAALALFRARIVTPSRRFSPRCLGGLHAVAVQQRAPIRFDEFGGDASSEAHLFLVAEDQVTLRVGERGIPDD